MNQTDFFDIMDAAEEQDIAAIVQSSHLRQFPAAKEETEMSGSIKKHNTKRRMTAAVMLAAAVLALCGAAAGAAANWNAGSIFTQFIGRQSTEEVDYNLFAALGTELGETMDFGDFTVTVDSILSDGQIVYVLYEYTLPDPKEMYPSEKNCFISPRMLFMTLDPESGRFLTPREGRWYGGKENGVYHDLAILLPDADVSLADAVIEVSCKGLYVTFDAYPDGTPMTQEVDYEPQTLTYSTEGITMEILKGTADADLPNGHFNGVTVSALSALILYDSILEYYNDFPAGVQSECEVTAIYADGTERTLTCSWTGNSWDSGYCALLPFSRPLSLEGLTAVRVFGTEIPVS